MGSEHQRKKSLQEHLADEYASKTPLFSVVVEKVVGEIFEGGDLSPYVAAFQLIGEVGEDGVYRFPSKDGKTVTVAVETNE